MGRSGELALLERHLAGEGPPVLLLAGEPGIGKTRLLHAAVPRALMQVLRVLEGSCQRRGDHAPYAPLLGALHRHIAETLERSPAAPSVEMLAYHYARSDAEDKALLYLEKAGDRAHAEYANAAAEAYYRELVERMDRLGRAPDGARAREKLGMTLSLDMVARYDAALAVLEQAAATFQMAGDLEGLARTLTQLGRVHAGRDMAEEGLARLQPLLERHGDSAPAPSRSGAALYAALAWRRLYGRRTWRGPWVMRGSWRTPRRGAAGPWANWDALSRRGR